MSYKSKEMRFEIVIRRDHNIWKDKKWSATVLNRQGEEGRRSTAEISDFTANNYLEEIAHGTTLPK